MKKARLKQFTVCCLVMAGSHLATAQETRQQKAQALYDSLVAYDIKHPKTVLAIALFETGWLECKKCAYNHNNLFGFRGNSAYMKFASISDCLTYLKKWQTNFYEPWHAKHPVAGYHDFLVHLKYAQDMPTYLKKIKWMEKWVSRNIKMTA